LGSCNIAGDYRIKAGSPAINKGVEVGYTHDKRGIPLNESPGIDLGAYEHSLTVGIYPQTHVSKKNNPNIISRYFLNKGYRGIVFEKGNSRNMRYWGVKGELIIR